MVSSKATTVTAYLKELSAERRAVVSAVRTLVKKSLPKGFEEVMQYGMIAWVVPFSRYSDTYNDHPLTICALASQKQSASLYLMSVYASRPLATWFAREWKKRGKKLDMGKSCLRFCRMDDLATDVLGEAVGKVGVDEFIDQYEASRKKAAKRR